MAICEQCGKDHDGTYGSGRFCCRSCSNRWVALHQSSEAKSRKVDKGKKNLTRSGSQTRICSNCGEVFKSNVYYKCPKCRHDEYEEYLKSTEDYSSSFVVCPYCGRSKHMINNRHLRSHNKTLQDLFTEYGSDYKYISDNFSNNKSETGIRKYNLSHITGHPRGKLIRVVHDDKTIVLRSSWEKMLFDILISLELKFQYEGLKIKYTNPKRLRDSVYIPDFYLPDYNLILEVKPSVMIDYVALSKRDACINQGYSYEFLDYSEITRDNLSKILSKI